MMLHFAAARCAFKYADEGRFDGAAAQIISGGLNTLPSLPIS